jgi:hypothetical protein
LAKDSFEVAEAPQKELAEKRMDEKSGIPEMDTKRFVVDEV